MVIKLFANSEEKRRGIMSGVSSARLISSCSNTRGSSAEQLVQGEEEKERIRYIVNRLAQQTMRGSVSAYWFLPLDSISYAALCGALLYESDKLYVSVFPYGALHQDELPRH